MIRALLDTNVLVSALLARRGAPAGIIDAWSAGAFEVVISDRLIAELEDVLARPKIRRHIPAVDAAAFVSLLRRTALLADDSTEVGPPTPDPDDSFLIALARSAACELIVSGDANLRALDGAGPPILTPRAFLETLGQYRP